MDSDKEVTDGDRLKIVKCDSEKVSCSLKSPWC